MRRERGLGGGKVNLRWRYAWLAILVLAAWVWLSQRDREPASHLAASEAGGQPVASRRPKPSRLPVQSDGGSRGPSTEGLPAKGPSRATRQVMLHGRVQVRPPSAGDSGEGELPGQLINPDEASIERMLESVEVKLRETGVTTRADSSGSFSLEISVDPDRKYVTLMVSSPFLVPEDRQLRRKVLLDSRNDTIEVHVPMSPAVFAKPMYQGRVITPAQLSDPAVRDEFNRQMREIIQGLIPVPAPPPDAEPALRDGDPGATTSDAAMP